MARPELTFEGEVTAPTQDAAFGLCYRSWGGVLLVDGADRGGLSFGDDDVNEVLGCHWPDFWPDEGHSEAKAAIEAGKAGGRARFQGFANTMKGAIAAPGQAGAAPLMR